MALVRVMQTFPVALSRTFRINEVPTDATGNITVTLSRLDGTIVSGPTVAGHPGVGEYTYSAPGHADLDLLTVDWAGTVAGSAVSARDWIEVVGGHFFELTDARATHTGLADAVAYPNDELAQKRLEVEQEFENICRQAFYPRFARHKLTGRGTAQLTIPQYLPHRMVRSLRAVEIGGVAWTQAQIDAVLVAESGTFTRVGSVWPVGSVWVEYEHGWDYPIETIRTAAMLRLKSLAGIGKTQAPANAISWTAQDGGTYRLSTPAADRTGIPAVDGILAGLTRKRRAGLA